MSGIGGIYDKSQYDSFAGYNALSGVIFLKKIHGEIWFSNFGPQATEVCVWMVSPKIDGASFDPLGDFAGNNYQRGYAVGEYGLNLVYVDGETQSQYGIQNYVVKGSTTLLNPLQSIWTNNYMFDLS